MTYTDDQRTNNVYKRLFLCVFIVLPDWKATSLNSIHTSLKWKRHLIVLAVRSPRVTVTKRALWLTLSGVGLKVMGPGSHSESDQKKHVTCRNTLTPRLNMLLVWTWRGRKQS